MGEQLSLKAAIPLAEILATCRKNVSNTGPWVVSLNQIVNKQSSCWQCQASEQSYHVIEIPTKGAHWLAKKGRDIECLSRLQFTIHAVYLLLPNHIEYMAIFVYKSNIWDAKCAWATIFILHLWMNVPKKQPTFLGRKCFTQVGLELNDLLRTIPCHVWCRIPPHEFWWSHTETKFSVAVHYILRFFFFNSPPQPIVFPLPVILLFKNR